MNTTSNTMFNSTNMYSIKHYTTTANKTLTYATVYIMNAYQKCPELYNFVVKNADTPTLDIIVALLCWIMVLMLLRNIVRTCLDPFSIKLHTKITELENKLSDEEECYSELYDENCEQAEKIVELTKKLEDAEKALADIKAQYLCCRKAAQTFIDSTAESDRQS